jgi:hypothetical protein
MGNRMYALRRATCVTLGLTCGTVGDRYPSAEITGLDLSPIQPTWVPPNVK